MEWLSLFPQLSPRNRQVFDQLHLVMTTKSDLLFWRQHSDIFKEDFRLDDFAISVSVDFGDFLDQAAA